jgi:aminoglycoside phosphotransferase (APT) family kinase protein
VSECERSWTMSGGTEDALRAVCARLFPADGEVEVEDATRITAGWESEIYSFAVAHGPPSCRQREELVLRIYVGADTEHKAVREFQGLKRLHGLHYPVPRVLVLEREPALLGNPFIVMEKVEGQALWPVLFCATGKKQEELLTLFCDLSVRLHSLDWRLFFDEEQDSAVGAYLFVDQWLSIGRERVERFQMRGFSRLLEWLEVRRDDVPCSRPSPVHGDYHPNNVILCADGSAVVIDWTGLQVSDARFDLAWTLLLVGSYRGEDWRNRILREYQRLAGTEVEQLEYFEVCACARRLSDVVVSLSTGAEQLGMRPGAVAAMREQMTPLGRVYGLLRERTGLRLAEVEELL